jgi:hypothetical protein
MTVKIVVPVVDSRSFWGFTQAIPTGVQGQSRGDMAREQRRMALPGFPRNGACGSVLK